MDRAALAELEVSLTKVINKWSEKLCDKDDSAWMQQGAWWSDNLILLMAQAAMKVMESNIDLTDYLRREDMLK